MSWAIGFDVSFVDTSIFALVYFGISLMKLYRFPSFSGISCQGEIVLSPSLKTTRNSVVPTSPTVELVTAARAMTLEVNLRACNKSAITLPLKEQPLKDLVICFIWQVLQH